MDKVNRILISLPVIIISFLFIYEGNTVLLISNNIQIHLNHNQNGDLEIPHQPNHNKSHDDEKWISSNSFELSCSSEKLSVFHFYQNKKTEDYARLIWQPPKSV
jgi:hypothetical protein